MQMRFLFPIGMLLFFAQILVLVWAYFYGPDVWVMKYDLSGNPIAMAPRNFFVGFFAVFLTITYSTVFVIRYLATNATSLRWINLPNRDHWLKPENQKQGIQTAVTTLDLTIVFLGAVNSLVLWLCFAQRSPFTVNAFLIGILVAVIALIVSIYRISKPKTRN